jgi:hypothetical protein
MTHPHSTTNLVAVADDVLPDVAAIEKQVDEVLGDEIYWFPVRHHSPAVAWHVQRAIEQWRPKLIFVEGPHEANHLLEHILDAKTRPPIAIYSSYRDDDNVLGLAGISSPAEDIPARFACWYPLVEYSPEYVTLQAAKKVKAKVVLMDLPHFAQIKGISASHESVEAESDEENDDLAKDRPPAQPAEIERLIVESGFFQHLATANGFKTWNEAWDTLFELHANQRDTEEFRRELAIFCAASRATSPTDRIAGDGTLERERFMWQTIQQTMKEKRVAAKDVMVVCGGFHLFLDKADTTPPPPAPAGAVYTSVVPYSYFRISELSGYGAGNRAPQFYQAVWQSWKKQNQEELLAEHVIGVLKKVRRAGTPLSSADAIAVTGHARMLARLRSRPEPILDDIQDALITCCCKGNPDEEGLPLLQAWDAVNIGHALGRVTDKLGQLPILNDFYTQMSLLDLGEVLSKEKRMNLTLDKREPHDGRRSAFLHRLTFLGIPIAEITDSATSELDTGMIFREGWRLKWSPSVENKLIDKNLYGDTVETAALAQIEEDLAKHALHAGTTCDRLVWSINMDLPGTMQRAEKACGTAIDADTRFVSLSEALTHLTVIDRYAEYRGLGRQSLSDLIVRCYDRSCFTLVDVANAPENHQAEIVEALKSLAEIVLRDEKSRGLDRSVFVQHVKFAAQNSEVPFLRGAFLGMLAELRVVPPEDLAAEISSLARAPVDKLITAGDLIEGILSVSRTSVMLGATEMVAAMDELLKAADWDAFLTMIPRLRGAFEKLHPRQCTAIAEAVARNYGLADAETLTEITTSLGAAALFARLDAEVAGIMAAWEPAVGTNILDQLKDH